MQSNVRIKSATWSNSDFFVFQPIQLANLSKVKIFIKLQGFKNWELYFRQAVVAWDPAPMLFECALLYINNSCMLAARREGFGDKLQSRVWPQEDWEICHAGRVGPPGSWHLY